MEGSTTANQMQQNQCNTFCILKYSFAFLKDLVYKIDRV